MQDTELAKEIVDYLNELLEIDRPAVAALIAKRVPCNREFVDHPTCQVGAQHGGFSVGVLGILNGLCGIDDKGSGPIQAVFGEPDCDGGFLSLQEFRVVEKEEEKDLE